MVSYWHWHSLPYGQETYWKGILSHDLQPNRLYAEMKRTGAELKQIGPHLVNLRIKPSVAILLSYDSNHALNIMPYREGANAYWRDVMPSLHRALYNNSIAADFIYPGRNQLKDYALVIIPPLYVASDAELAEIDAYVRNGGHVVMLFKSGFCDENSTVRTQLAPGPLRSVCGFHYQEFGNIKTLPLASNPYGVSEADNQVMDWAELLLTDTAKPIAFYQHPFYGKWPAITRNLCGKGSLLYEGCRPSDALQEKIIMDEIARAGLAKPELQTHFPLITKCGVNDFGKTVRFIYNYSEKAQSFTYTGPGGQALLDGRHLNSRDPVTIAPWDLLIVEE